MAASQRSRRAGKALIARRNLVCLAGGLAAALLIPRVSSAQRFTASSISQAAQDARREVGRLGQRADNILRHVIEAGPNHEAEAVGRFRNEQGPLARELATVINRQVSEDDWLLIVPTRELDLVLAMRSLVIRIAPTPDMVEAALKEPLVQIEPLPGDSADDVLLMLVLGTLGVKRRVALFEVIRNDRLLAAAVKDAVAAAKARHYGLVALELERVMRAVTQPGLVAGISENLGNESALNLYNALVVRFVPFIGWSYFTSMLLATVYYNRDTTATVLR